MVTSSKSKRLKLNTSNVVIETQVEMPKLIEEGPLVQHIPQVG